VTCTTAFFNNFTSSSTPTTTPPSEALGAGTKAPGASPGAGATGQTGSAPGAGGSTGPPTKIVGTLGSVPFGAPQTGFGGASHSRDGNLLFAGVLALVGAGLALTIAVRRRRTLAIQDADATR
jgi:hypothetical protein